MPYVSYNRPLSKVGFRVMNQTNPAHAASLSGISPNVTRVPQYYYLHGLGAQAIPLSLANPDAAGQAPAICLDESENTIDCSDPGCMYGDCGSTAPQLTSGPLCLDETENQIDCSNPNCKYGDCISAPAATAPAHPGAGVPTGSQLSYSATLAASLTASTGQAQILSQVAGGLPSSGIQVTSSNFSVTGLTTFNVQLGLLVTGAGFNQASDVKSIVDHAFYVQMGQMPMASNIAVGAVPGGGAGGGILNAIFGGGSGAGAGGAGAQPAWALQLEQDLPWLLLGIGIIVAIPSVIKKL